MGKALQVAIALGTLATLLAAGLGTSTPRVDAQQPYAHISIRGPTGSGITLLGGDAVTTALTVSDLLPPGLGAWTVDVGYNPTAVAVEACTPAQMTPATIAVCNPTFAYGVLRVTGADPSGVVGDAVVAEITFRCRERDGKTELAVTVPTFADATVGDPQPINASRGYGSILCSARDTPRPTPTATPTSMPELPLLGTGAQDNIGVLGWFVVALGSLGAAAVVSSVIIRTRKRAD